MAESVHDYHSIPEKNDKGNEPTDPTEAKEQQSSETSSSDPQGSVDTGAVFQQSQNHGLSTEIDNSSFKRILEQELFGPNSRPVNCDPANDVGSSSPAPEMISNPVSASEPVLGTESVSGPGLAVEPESASEPGLAPGIVSAPEPASEPVSPAQASRDFLPEKDAPRIDPSYYDLIQEQHRDQNPSPKSGMDTDLIGALARSLNDRDQFAAPRFEENPAPNLYPDQRTNEYHIPNAQKTGFWTKRVMLGSVVLLSAMVAGGMFVKTRGIPGVLDKITQVSLAGKTANPLTATGSEEITIAKSMPAAKGEDSKALYEANFVSAPRSITSKVEKSTKIFQDRLPSSSPDPQAKIKKSPETASISKVGPLTVRLKAVRTLLSSLQTAHSNASAPKKPALTQEIAKVKGVIAALEAEIVAITPSQPPVKTAGASVAPINTPAPVPAPVATAVPHTTPAPVPAPVAAPTPQPASASVRVVVQDPVVKTPDKRVVETGSGVSHLSRALSSSRPRDPKKVELALASAAGLYKLGPVRRQRLKTKLINGECLVPALSSVFPQVPVLVMRDMIRQLGEQC